MATKSKLILPKLSQFKESMRGVADHLMKTQKEGFGASLVASMDFHPERDIDAFQIKNINAKSAKTKTTEIIPANDLPHFSSAASPFGCFAGTVSASSCDASGRIHSGVLATLADVESSIHLWAFSGPKSVHVSVGIDVTFTAPETLLAPAEGEKLLLITRSPKVGKQLAFLEFQMYRLTRETLDDAKEKYLMSCGSSENAGGGAQLEQLLFIQNEESRIDTSKGKQYECYGASRRRKVIEDADFETSPLALQSFLMHQGSSPFATGWHEKAFIPTKK